jgi:colicin import membrane protein
MAKLFKLKIEACRLEEQRKLEEEKRLLEQQRLVEEQKKLEEQRKLEEERRLEAAYNYAAWEKKNKLWEAKASYRKGGKIGFLK